GRYPVCCLFLEIDPASVDVNIHPAKREVKFHQERAVRQWVTQAIRQTLLQFHALPEMSAVKDRRLMPQAESRSVPEPSAPRPREFSTFTPLTGTPLTAWPSRPIAPPPHTAPAPVPQPPL